MDLRLVFPAAGLWLGVATTFFVTGQDPDPLSRHSESQRVLLVLAFVVAFTVTVAIYYWRLRPSEFGSQLFIACVIFTTFVILGCFSAALHVHAHTSEPLATWINQKPNAQIRGVISNEVQRRVTSTAAMAARAA